MKTAQGEGPAESTGGGARPKHLVADHAQGDTDVSEALAEDRALQPQEVQQVEDGAQQGPHLDWVVCSLEQAGSKGRGQGTRLGPGASERRRCFKGGSEGKG